MDQVVQYFGVAMAGLLASILSGFAGSGGGLISTPFLILIGIPPHVALGTIRFASLGNSIGALQRLAKGGQVIWKLAVPLSVISLVAAWFGAQALIDIAPDVVRKVIGGVMILLVPAVFYKSKYGIDRIKKSALVEKLGYLAYGIVAFFHAAFGSGIATFLNYVLIYMFGLTATQASATRRIPTMVLTVVTLIVFAQHSFVHYGYGVLLFVTMYIGSSIGAHLALLKGNVWVMRLLGTVVVLSAVKLLV